MSDERTEQLAQENEALRARLAALEAKTVSAAGRLGGQRTRELHGVEHYRRMGRAGGATVRERYGAEFFRVNGKKGGDRMAAKHGLAFYSEIGRKGGAKTRDEHDADYYSVIAKKGAGRPRSRRGPPADERMGNASALRQARLRAGLSQSDVAAHLGLTCHEVSHMETGRVGFGRHVDALCACLGCAADDLRGQP